MQRVYKLTVFLWLSIVLSACVTKLNQDRNNISQFNEPIELTTVPFYPQSRFQCGPAALASVLNYSGLEIDKNQLTEEIYIPGRKGSLQVEMIAAVRRHGRIPYQQDANLQSILQNLQQDLPSLVLLNLGLNSFPVYHYAVVIGYETDTDSIILRSGKDPRLPMTRREFLTTWEKAGKWALVVLPGGMLPQTIDIDRYLSAVITLESTGQWQAAELGYRTVLTRQPTSTLARFGLANCLRMQEYLEEAVIEYEKVLKQDPGYKAALNNLADTLLRLGQCGQAAATLDQVTISEDTDLAVDNAIRETRLEIQLACPRWAVNTQ